MPTLDNHASSLLAKVEEAIWGDFTSIRIDGNYLIFVDQSTQLIRGRVPWSAVELVEGEEVWKGDV